MFVKRLAAEAAKESGKSAKISANHIEAASERLLRELRV